MGKNVEKFVVWENLKKLDCRDLIIFLIPFLIFIYYLYVYDPGILTQDSFYQMNQIASSNFTNWHPFFHTFIEMLCLKLYPDTKSVAILQIIVFSTIWMIICNYLRNDADTKFNKEFGLQALFTLLISLIPINAVFSISLIKDTLFSYFLLFVCFLIKVMLDKKGNVSFSFVLILSLLMAFVAQLRNNGMIVIVLFLVMLVAYILIRYKNKKLALSIVSLTVLFILLISVLNISYGVVDNDKDAVAAKVSHMLADYELNLSIDDKDKALIGSFIDESKIEKNYDITFSDPISHLINRTAYANNKSAIIELAVIYSITNPYHFLQYMFHSSPMVWDIVKGDDWKAFSYVLHTDSSRKNFYSKYDATPLASYDNVTAKNAETNLFNDLDSFAAGFYQNKLADTLFNNPAFYMYLSFILLGAIYLLTKSREVFFVYLLNLLNIIVIFLSTPVQSYRYLYPNLLLCYFLVIMLIGIITMPKKSIL